MSTKKVNQPGKQKSAHKRKSSDEVQKEGNAKKFKSAEVNEMSPKAKVNVSGTPSNDKQSVNKKRKKYRSKKKKLNTDDTATAVLSKPKKTTDTSANWKALLAQISKEQPEKKPERRKFVKSEKKSTTMKKVEEEKKKPDIWFDDVDELLLDPDDRPNKSAKTSEGGNDLVKDKSFKGLTRLIGMDCEMVGVGLDGKRSILARCSIVNHFGNCIYDKFVKPTEKVTDYRTAVSGIRPKDLNSEDAVDFKTVQTEISEMLTNRILIGHAVHHDLKVLFLSHPKRDIRDTSTYKPFRNAFGGRTPSLKNLTAKFVGVLVQSGEHSSVQDAQAAMRLYTMYRKEWESEMSKKIKVRKGKPKKKQAMKMRTLMEDSDDSD